MTCLNFQFISGTRLSFFRSCTRMRRKANTQINDLWFSSNRHCLPERKIWNLRDKESWYFATRIAVVIDNIDNLDDKRKESCGPKQGYWKNLIIYFENIWQEKFCILTQSSLSNRHWWTNMHRLEQEVFSTQAKKGTAERRELLNLLALPQHQHTSFLCGTKKTRVLVLRES